MIHVYFYNNNHRTSKGLVGRDRTSKRLVSRDRTSKGLAGRLSMSAVEDEPICYQAYFVNNVKFFILTMNVGLQDIIILVFQGFTYVAPSMMEQLQRTFSDANPHHYANRTR